MARETGPDLPAETGAFDGAATRRSAEGFRGVNRSARRWGPVSHYLKRLWAAPVIAGAITVAAAGTALALDITGTEGHDRIVGSRGVDTINALGGPDRVFARAGDDVVSLGDGSDFVRGGRGNDALDLGEGSDRAHGGLGDDNVQGGVGDDRIIAGWGDDTVDAGPGFDRVRGRRGNDSISGGEGFDVLHGGRGQDTLSGGPGNDRLFSSWRADPESDTLNGDEGDDRIFVRDGVRDVVTCGPGIDRVRADQMDSVAADCETVRLRTR